MYYKLEFCSDTWCFIISKQEWTEDERCWRNRYRTSLGAREVKTEPETGLSQGKSQLELSES